MAITKSQMIKTIRNANARMKRIEKAGYQDLQSYRQLQAGISRLYNENPFDVSRRKTLKVSPKRTVSEIKKEYGIARQFVKNPESSVRYVKRHIKSIMKKAKVDISTKKRIQTFSELFGAEVDATFFNIFNSNEYKKLQETYFPSDNENWLADYMVQERADGRSIRELKRKMKQVFDIISEKNLGRESAASLFEMSDSDFNEVMQHYKEEKEIENMLNLEM